LFLTQIGLCIEAKLILFIAHHKINTPISQSLPHIKYLAITKLNWTAPSLHPNKGLVKFSSVEAIMAVSSTTILDQIARFFIFFSDAPLYWYSLNKSCNDAFHLAKQFGMDKDNYKVLLVAGYLAKYKRESLCIMADQWKSFLGGHDFSDLSPGHPTFEF
jgi:hypothetical protein